MTRRCNLGIAVLPVVFKQEGQESRLSTIVIRGATENLMDDVERAVDDAVNNFKILTKDGQLLPGAGAVEMELSNQIAKYADTCPGLEQYSIKKFAEALEVFPRTLAQNSGLSVTKSIAALVAKHVEGDANAGLNVEGEGDALTLDAPKAGIYDMLLTKHWGFKYAVHATNTVLKVDEIIMAKQAGGPKAGPPGGGDDDD